MFEMKKLLFVLFLSLVCCQSEIYLEDGIIKCQEDVSVGFVGEIDGVSYKVVDSLILKTMIKNSEDLRFICTTKITDMGSMFNSSEFNGDISKWDVSKVTNMGAMFSNSKFNGDTSKWDVSNITNMNGMFFNSKFNGDISKWDVSKVTNMNGMFSNSKFNGDISKWDVSSVTEMSFMFSGAKFNGDISKWDVSNVLSCEGFSDNNLQWTLPQPKFTNCDTKNREPDFHDDLEYYN